VLTEIQPKQIGATSSRSGALDGLRGKGSMTAERRGSPFGTLACSVHLEGSPVPHVSGDFPGRDRPVVRRGREWLTQVMPV